ncbi:hypothetical protein B0H66DRAFT_76455 [Apodospora peruviana]|uniref:Uncharacterized protein n=1 Tax=Apodospora peruviana TaxID=516989 RepID=A0AAE0ITF2_9PEZI|nr:hypothetical protein B0H66DRAFT_76455 [Apodospora peruviana]
MSVCAYLRQRLSFTSFTAFPLLLQFRLLSSDFCRVLAAIRDHFCTRARHQHHDHSPQPLQLPERQCDKVVGLSMVVAARDR